MSQDNLYQTHGQEVICGPITKIVNDSPDSIEIGTPAKGGATKIYGNFNNPEEFKKKIDNAKLVKEYAQANLMVNV